MTYEYTIRVLPEVAANEQRLKAYLVREKGLDERTLNATRILKRSIDATSTKCPRTTNTSTRTTPTWKAARKSSSWVPAQAASLPPCASSSLACAPWWWSAARTCASARKTWPRSAARRPWTPSRTTASAKAAREPTPTASSTPAARSAAMWTRYSTSSASTDIGTDKLPRVIENMRNTILQCGGEVHFQTRMDALLIEGDEVKGIETHTGQTFLGPVILATGHSARDVYRWLAANGVEIEAKGIAVGVRLEHPAHLIDQIQYHNRNGRGKYLPAAEYSFVTQVEGRGVYSFCMCPGGFIVPAASGPEQIVVNGMSPSNRGSRWSNSGMVVEIRPEDLENEELRMKNEEILSPSDNSSFGSTASILHSSLNMLSFQEHLERLCWQQGNRRQTAPAQRMADFVNRRLSADLPETSYAPGLIASPLHFWLPPFIAGRLAKGFQQFGRNAHGFLTNDAVMIAVETRTSAPVRIVRDRDTLQHVRLRGLFPCGEGAGYAGGIVSAGVDGERCAEAAAEYREAQ